MGKVYACSDLHGMYELWKQIENHLQEDDKLIFLGDAADRGMDGLQIITDLLTDPRVTYLKGNHEQMMIDVGFEILEGRTSSINLWLQNGGSPTLRDFMKLSDEAQVSILNKLKKLPQFLFYENKKGQRIFLSHAGAMMKDIVNDNIDNMNLLWDRNHFWEEIDEYDSKDYDKNLYIVHGHTPTQILNQRLAGTYSDNEIRVYCDGHKIDIDIGCAFSNQVALLDLDTFEPIYFKFEEGPDGVSR